MVLSCSSDDQKLIRKRLGEIQEFVDASYNNKSEVDAGQREEGSQMQKKPE